MKMGKGSMFGEEDVIRNNLYSASVKCTSQYGTLYKVEKEDFMTLKKSDEGWIKILEKAMWKEKRKQGDFIQEKEVV